MISVMNKDTLKALLESVQSGEVPIDEAIERLRRLPFEEMGFATIDHHRAIRCGFPEVILCSGKTVEQSRASSGMNEALDRSLTTTSAPAIRSQGASSAVRCRTPARSSLTGSQRSVM